MKQEKELIEILRLRLSKNRFNHSLQVAEEAVKLADKYKVDREKAYLTGLLHDYAKGLSGQELLNIAEENGLINDQVDRDVPDLLHAPVGALLLKKELKIKDVEILHAVSCHTLADIDMNDLDKIIFLADMIEPGRDFPGIERLRCLTAKDLDEAMLFGLESTIKYCIDQKRIIHPKTIIVRNKFVKMLKQ